MGIDPAYGSSAFGIVVTQLVDGNRYCMLKSITGLITMRCYL